jgi:hypothetical protein
MSNLKLGRNILPQQRMEDNKHFVTAAVTSTFPVASGAGSAKAPIRENSSWTTEMAAVRAEAGPRHSNTTTLTV